MNDWKALVGNNVKIFLKTNNIIYHGKVISAGDNYIQITDKFDKVVYIILENILTVEVEA